MPVRPTLLHRSGPRFFSTVRFVTKQNKWVTAAPLQKFPVRLC